MILKLLPFPIAFFIIFTPIATDRLVRLFGVVPPPIVPSLCTVLLMSDGAVNSILFIRRKSLVLD